MSTDNIIFHGEISKIYIIFVCKSALSGSMIVTCDIKWLVYVHFI